MMPDSAKMLLSAPLLQLLYQHHGIGHAIKLNSCSFSRWSLLRLLTLFGLIHFGGVVLKPKLPHSIAQTSSQSQKLTSGGTRGEIRGNTVILYDIDLLANQYLQMVIAKDDLRLSATVYSPDKKTVAEFTSEDFAQGNVAFIAEQSGTHLLELRSLETSANARLYEIKMQVWRAATSTDRKYLSALQLFSEAIGARKAWKGTLFRKAIRKYSLAAAGWSELGNNADAADALSQAGDVYFMLSDYRSALRTYQEALRRYTMATDSFGRMKVQNSIGYALLYLGRKPEASTEIQSVLDFCSTPTGDRQHGVDRLCAQALNSMGEIYYAHSDLPKALNFFQRSLDIWTGIPDRRGQALARLNLGYSYYDLGDIDEAAKYYQQALQLYQEVDERRGEALSRTALGGVYSFVGEKERALEYHSKAMALFQVIEDREGEAAALNGVGKAYEDLNDTKTALEKYGRALQLYKETGNRDFEAISSYYVGRSYRLGNDFSEAVRYLNRCVTLSRQLRTPRFEAYALRDLAIISDSLGQRNQALRGFERVLTLYKQSEDRRGQAYALNSIGYVYYEMGRLGDALQYFAQALPLSQAARDRQAELSILYNLARAQRDQSNLDEALARTRDSIAIIESLRTKIISHDLRASYLASLHEHYELAIDLLMMLWKRSGNKSFLQQAVEYSEQSRARSLLEVLGEMKTSGRSDISLEMVERKLRLEKLLEAKAEYQMRLLNGKHSDESAAKLIDEIHSLTAEYDALQSEIRSQSPSYALFTRPQLLEFSDIQSQIQDDNTLLLEYSLGDDRSYLWIVSRSFLNAYQLPNKATIEAACRRYYELVTSRQPKLSESNTEYQERVARSDKEFCRTSKMLSEMLLGPVANQLERKKLLISGDGALHYIPFDALTLTAKCEDTGTDWLNNDFVPLMTDHEIVELPSVSVLAALRQQKPQNARKTLFVFADPVFEANDPRLVNNRPVPSQPMIEQADLDHAVRDLASSGNGFRISRLPGTLREARNILGLAAPSEGAMVSGLQADLTTARSPELANYRILHFATHGIIDSENPQLSGLVLSRFDERGNSINGFLRLRDIYNLSLNADLVVLSACRTGLGKDVRGEGLVGLTQGFMYAGAKGVVGSLWKVDDEATAELMSNFYSSMLRDGLSPAAALQSSKMIMWKQKRWRSPYYWSAFVLQGQDETVTSNAVNHRRLIYSSAAAILTLLFVASGYYFLRLVRTRRLTR
jgi:CHAT domain-containing protein